MDSAHLTQAALASAVGITQSAVSDYFRGGMPSGEMLIKIALVLGVSAEYLLGADSAAGLSQLFANPQLVADITSRLGERGSIARVAEESAAGAAFRVKISGPTPEEIRVCSAIVDIINAFQESQAAELRNMQRRAEELTGKRYRDMVRIAMAAKKPS